MTERSKLKIGVIGAGSFGTAIARLLAYNVEVLIYSRKPKIIDKINQEHFHLGMELPENLRATNDVEGIVKDCNLIFPIVSSDNFRVMLKNFSPFLTPQHILIHGTKGLDTTPVESEKNSAQVYTMSEVILQETNVVRVGCLSGPNLAAEIMDGQPTATVVASEYDEVIKLGQQVLSSDKFHVFGSSDIKGAELAGALKNVVAIGSGILKGMGLGKNMQAVLITQGWREMIRFGEAIGSPPETFFTVAGIGDLIATTTSKKSRNYTFGFRLGQGESVEEIEESSEELAEGVRTVKICKALATHFNLRVPVFEAFYKIIVEGEDRTAVIDTLIRNPY
ncbi:MAG: NAD(P)H-dependent glycerol-3-phosphate dehydrogenase [Bacteroidota bacterium]